MGYRDNYPANVESPYRVFFQYSDGIDWDWNSGVYPTGMEKGWNWEERFIPVTHKNGTKTIGPHTYMRIKIGSGRWSIPIKISQTQDDLQDLIAPLFTHDNHVNLAASYNDGSDQIVLEVPNDLTVISNYNTNDLVEGTSNLYYTNERVDDRVNNLLVGGNDITLNYNDGSNILTISSNYSYSFNITDGNTTTTINSNNNLVITDGTDIVVNESDGTTTISTGLNVTKNDDTDVLSNSWVLDEDGFTTNSDTKLATQQSIKSYVDSASQGLSPKEPVIAASDGTNIDLTSSSYSGSLDDVTLSDGNRVLLKDQNTASENGLYNTVTATDPSSWTRTTDADEDSEVNSGMFVFVEEGATNSNKGFVLTTDNPIAVDGSDLNFVLFSSAGQIDAGTGLNKSGDTINHDSASAHEAGGSVEITHNNLTINSDDHHTKTPNIYATGVSGDGNSTLNITRNNASDISADLSHNHTNYDNYGHFNIWNEDYSSTSIYSGGNLVLVGSDVVGLEQSDGTVWISSSNYYLSDAVGSGDGTLDLQMSGGTQDVVVDLSHEHSDYITSDSGKTVAGSIHDGTTDENSVFDIMKSSVPNTGDEIIISGRFNHGSSHEYQYTPSKAKRTSSSEIQLYCNMYNTSTDESFLRTWYLVNGESTGMYKVSLAW